MKIVNCCLPILALACIVPISDGHAFEINVVEEPIRIFDYRVEPPLPDDKCKVFLDGGRLKPGESPHWVDGTIIVTRWPQRGEHKVVRLDRNDTESLRFCSENRSECESECEYQATGKIIKKNYWSGARTVDAVVTKTSENYVSEHRQVGRPCFIGDRDHEKKGVIVLADYEYSNLLSRSIERYKKEACESTVRKIATHELPKVSQIAQAYIQLGSYANSCRQALQFRGATHATLNRELSCKSFQNKYPKAEKDANELFDAIKRANVDMGREIMDSETWLSLTSMIAAKVQISTQVNSILSLIGEDELRKWLGDKK